MAYPRQPLEDYILSRLQARLMIFLKKGGDAILREYIVEELAQVAIDPKEEIARVEAELATLKKNADRLLDNLTATNRDFVDEKLVGIRGRMRELEAQREDLTAMNAGQLTVEAVTAQALAQIERFRQALAHGSMVQQKEFLRGLVAGITLYPGENRGVVRFYDLIPASFKFSGGTPEELEKMRVWPDQEAFRWRQEGWIQAA